jgi:hypothetical protein
VLNPLAWTVAKTAIQSLTKSTVNWINSGFDGSPAYVTDLNQNLRSLGDKVANDFFASLEDNTGVNVRTPFQDQVTQAVRNSYYRSTGSFSRNYNLNAHSSDPNAFISGDFTKGGFDAWFAVALNDDNNPIGSIFKTKSDLMGQVEAFHQNRLRELQWGNGFLSWRGDCAVTQNQQAAANDAMNAPVEPAANSVPLSQEDKCAAYNIETPGSVLEHQLNITADSPLKQLELADSFNEIVAALMTQMVSKVLGGTGLAGISHPSSGGGSSFATQATDPTQYNNTAATIVGGFVNQVSTSIKDVTTFKQNWSSILAAAQAAQSSLNTCGDPDSQISTTVQPVIDRANTAIKRADDSLTELAAIQASSANASSTPAGIDPTAAVSNTTDRYAALLSSGTLPTASEIAEAKSEAENTSASSPLPLIVQMNQLAATSCNQFGRFGGL